MLINKLDELLSLPEAAARLVSGQPVIFPTDTVWGIGARWQSERGVRALYHIKQHEEDKPLGILVADMQQLAGLGIDFDRMAPAMHASMVKLMKALWPGGLTIVLPWPSKPDYCLWPVPTVGVRVPDHPITQGLLNAVGPIIQSSANASGGMPPAAFEALLPEFVALSGGVVAGESGGEMASTVVDLTGEELKIVRAGCVPVAEIEAVLK